MFSFCVKDTEFCIGVSTGDEAPVGDELLQVKSIIKNDKKGTSPLKLQWFVDNLFIRAASSDVYFSVNARGRPQLSKSPTAFKVGPNGEIEYDGRCLTLSGCLRTRLDYCNPEVRIPIDSVDDIELGSYVFLVECGESPMQSFDFLPVNFTYAPSTLEPTTSPLASVPTLTPTQSMPTSSPTLQPTLATKAPTGSPSKTPTGSPTSTLRTNAPTIVGPSTITNPTPSPNVPTASTTSGDNSLLFLGVAICIACLLFGVYLYTRWKRSAKDRLLQEPIHERENRSSTELNVS